VVDGCWERVLSEDCRGCNGWCKLVQGWCKLVQVVQRGEPRGLVGDGPGAGLSRLSYRLTRQIL